MKTDLQYQNGKLLLSYAFLKKCMGAKFKKVEKAVTKRNIKPIKILGVSYLNYDCLYDTWFQDIPQSKAELILKATSTEKQEQVEYYTSQMQPLKDRGFAKYVPAFKGNYNLKQEKAIEAAQMKAVAEYVLEQYKATGKLEVLHLAFCNVYPGKYSHKVSFKQKFIDRANEKGIDSVCIKESWFTAPQNVKRINPVVDWWNDQIAAIGVKFGGPKTLQILESLCQKAGYETPSLRWVQAALKKAKKNIHTAIGRDGQKETAAKKLPYVSTHHALRVNDQWQMDGWTLPFWGDAFQRYTVVVIRDAHSKKIIGSAFGESENTILILEALQKAIINTGSLPFEILTDNHAFNQTKEAEYFKTAIEAYGSKWTVTHNPQHKSIIERYNRHLDSHCKEYYGYIGAGIKAKSADARPKQELIDEYSRNFLSKEEIRAIWMVVYDRFNREYKKQQNQTPEAIYESADKEHCIKLSQFDRIKILTPKTEAKVTRGQITIKRGSTKYEYQLPAEYFLNYNDETVIVRYENLSECIYIYDKTTDELITDVRNKPKVHGAIANQAEEDKQILFNNKGKLEGIKNAAWKAKEERRRQALKLNPDAIDYLNRALEPKNVVQEIEQNAHLRRLAAEEGINPLIISIPKRENPIAAAEESRRTKLENKKPFKTVGHKPGIINLKEMDE